MRHGGERCADGKVSRIGSEEKLEEMTHLPESGAKGEAVNQDSGLPKTASQVMSVRGRAGPDTTEMLLVKGEVK